MHVDERVLAQVRERFGEPLVLDWEGEVSDPRAGDDHVQPLAHPRRDAVRLQRRPAGADPQAALPRGHLANARRRRQAGRGLRRRRRARGTRGARRRDRARPLPRRGAGGVPLCEPDGPVADTSSCRRRRPGSTWRRRTRRRSPRPAGGRPPSWPGRSASACSPPAARCGATASPSTTPHCPPSTDPDRRRPLRPRPLGTGHLSAPHPNKGGARPSTHHPLGS